MPHNSPRLCWKTIAFLSLLLVALIGAVTFAHNRLTVDNHPSSQVFIPPASRH